MSGNTTAGLPGQGQPWVTATEWFSGGQRVWYDPASAQVLNEEEGVATPGALRVFERVAAAEHRADAVWLTLLPGFPDGSYGWAQVDVKILTFPGGHLITSEHPGLLAAAIRDVAQRHGMGSPATVTR
jgi:hypothetical protein